MYWINCFPKCLWKVLGYVFKTILNVSRGLCWPIFSQKFFYFNFVWLSAETLLTFQKNVLLRTKFLLVHSKKSSRISSFEKANFKFALGVLSEGHREFGKSFGHGCQNCLLCVWRIFWWQFFWYKVNSFIFQETYFPRCLWKILREVVKTIFNVSKRCCCAIRLFEKVVVIWILSEF